MIALITAIAALILAVIALAIVVVATVGVHREYQADWLPVLPPGPLTGLARRILGLHVRRPSADVPKPNVPNAEHGEPTGATQSGGASR